MSTRRVFVRTVAIAVGGWCLLIVLTRYVLAWLQFNYYYASKPFFFVQGVNFGFEVVMPLQIAVWLLWYRSATNRWKVAACVCLILTMVKMLLYVLPSYYDIVQFDAEYTNATPLLLKLLYAFFALVQVLGYAVGIHLLSPIVRFQLVPTREISDVSIRPGQWSVGSLMLMTGVAACTLAITQATLRLQAELYFDLGFVASLGKGTFISLVYHSFDAMMVASFLIFIAKNPGLKWRKVARWLPVIAWTAIKSVFDLGYLYFAYPDFVTSMDPLSHLTSTGTSYIFQALTIDVVTRWFFRRWNEAGFQLISSSRATAPNS